MYKWGKGEEKTAIRRGCCFFGEGWRWRGGIIDSYPLDLADKAVWIIKCYPLERSYIVIFE